jgi:sugar lactone lactonase YvrE
MLRSHKVRTSEPVCVAPIGDACGEGPLWHAQQQAIFWTDINRFLIHRLTPRDGAVRSWFFDEPVTAIALTASEDWLAVVLGSRVIFWNPFSRTNGDERRDSSFRLPGWPHVRLNDARPDPRGSLWLGTMRNNVNPDGSPGRAEGTDGALIRLDPDGFVTEWKQSIGIGNTLVWSPARDRFYFADTLQNTIWAYDYDAATGAIGNERAFFQGFPRGLPDGSAMDAEGCLWNCRHGGHCIVRLDQSGAEDAVIELPVQNVTSCTFGGADLKTLYVTTARIDSAPSERLAGGLFALETSIAGLAENRFCGVPPPGIVE